MVDINKIYSNMLENQELQEGINDTAIFKAVFLAGGPGSGKSFIGTEKKGKSPTAGGDPKIFMGGGQLGLINLGLRVVNPDPAYEKLLKDAGLDAKNSADIWSDKGQEIRVKATDLTAKQKSLYVDGRLGVVVDGTGANINKIKGQKSLLDKVGYECAMIYVNTNLETAIARDAKRDRTIGADKVTEMWNNVQKNLKSYEGIFGKSNMYVIDNSDGSNWNAEAKKAHKKLEKWIRKDPTDPKAKAWIETQKMRNAPKSGIKEEDSNYLPGYSTGFYGHDPYTHRARMQELHHDIRRCSSINDACNEVSEKWHEKLAELSKTNATHLDDLDDEDIAILLPYAEEMRKEQMSLSEGFMDTFMGRDMKKGNVARQNPIRTLGKLGKKNKSIVRKLIEETRRFEKAINGELFGTRLQRQETSKFMKSIRNDSTTMSELAKDFENALHSWNAALDNSIENELLDPMDEDYWQDKIYLVKDLVKKILSEMWKIDESVELDEVFGVTIGLGFVASTLIKVAATTLMGAIIGGEIGASRKKSAGWTARPRRENSILDLISDKATLKTMQKKYPEALEMIGKNKDIINYSKSITNAKGGPDKEQMQTLKKMIKDEFEKSGISWSDFISSVEPLVRKSVKDAKKKMDESVELDENFIAFDYDHEVLTHFQTKADGMRWKNHKNAPDSYYLVKTKHRLLKGDMASEGSDSLSKHLDSQPFPKKDGANFSVHKESVELDESVKNLHQSQLPEGFMDTMKQLVPGAKGKPQKPRKGQKTAMEMQFPYARLSVHRMIEALRKARKVERRFNAKDLSFMLDVVEEIARTRHGEQPNSGMAIHDVMNIDDVTQSYFMNKIAQNDWKKTDQAILDAMVGNGTDDYTKGGAYVKNLARDIALSVKYAKKDAGIKESVELDEKGPKVDMKKYAAHMDRNKKKKTMSSTKKNLSSIAKRAEKKANEARDKFLNIETQLDELSPKTKKSYSDKANRAVDNEKKYAEKYSDAAKADPENPKYKKRADAHKRKAKNRAAGMKNANLDELSMTKADLSKTGMKVDTKKMAELKKELARLKKGLKKESIDESTRFENESAEMVMRDLLIMQNKIIDLVEMMDIEMGASEMEELGLEPWVVAKITKAKDYLDSIHDYTVMDNDNDE